MTRSTHTRARTPAERSGALRGRGLNTRRSVGPSPRHAHDGRIHPERGRMGAGLLTGLGVVPNTFA